MAALGLVRTGARSLRFINRISINSSCHRISYKNARFFHFARNLLSERKYSKDHEWVTVDNNNIGTVGVSQHAQESLGDIVFVQLPELETEVEKDGECGAVESVKAASELYSPVSGTVTDVNKALEETPGLVNSSPYEKGWIFKLQLSDAGELDDLMNEAAYKEYTASE